MVDGSGRWAVRIHHHLFVQLHFVRNLIDQLKRFEHDIHQRSLRAVALLRVVFLKFTILRILSDPMLEPRLDPLCVLNFLKVINMETIKAHLCLQLYEHVVPEEPRCRAKDGVDNSRDRPNLKVI